jgi:hypothetical protein
LVDSHKFGAELLQAMKLRHFPLGFPESCGTGKAFGHGLAVHAAGETELRIMTRVVGLSAMAGRLATVPGHGGNGSRSQVTETEELLQQLGTVGF